MSTSKPVHPLTSRATASSCRQRSWLDCTCNEHRTANWHITSVNHDWESMSNAASTGKTESAGNHVAPPAYLLAVSRTLELSLQSSFQLSLTVLVCYRTRALFSLRWSLPPTLGCTRKQPDSSCNQWTPEHHHYRPDTHFGSSSPSQWNLGNGPMSNDHTKHHTSCQLEAEGFGAGLFPLHSQLLRESFLVSFPPLTDMLKFSGYSRPSLRSKTSHAKPDARGTLPLPRFPSTLATLGNQQAQSNSPWSAVVMRQTGASQTTTLTSMPIPVRRQHVVQSLRSTTRAVSHRRKPTGQARTDHIAPRCTDIPPFRATLRTHRAIYSNTLRSMLLTDPQTGRSQSPEDLGRHMRSRCRWSRCPAIHTMSRSSLRSSSTHEPSDPPPRVSCYLRLPPDREHRSDL